MVFTTHIFLFYFLPLFLLVYFALPRGWRNLWITVASYIFYGWWQPWFVCLMMFTTCLDFLWGRFITRPGATHVFLAHGLDFCCGGDRRLDQAARARDLSPVELAQEILAASLYGGRGSAISGQAAADLHRFPRLGAETVELSTSRNLRRANRSGGWSKRSWRTPRSSSAGSWTASRIGAWPR